LVRFARGTTIPTDNCLYIILDGVADTEITLQRSVSGEALRREASPGQSRGGASGPSGGTPPHTRSKTEFHKNSSSNVSTMTQRTLALSSGEMINIKVLQLFRAGSESEAFANQTVTATAATDMTCYMIRDVDVQTMAKTPQTKNAYQVRSTKSRVVVYFV
jgi:hypothetical protein